MVLEKGFSFKNRSGNYYIEDGYVKYDEEVREAEVYNNVISGIENIEPIYLSFASINTKNDNEIVNFCNNYGRLGIAYLNDMDGTNDCYNGFEQVEWYIDEIAKVKAILSLKEALEEKGYIKDILTYMAFLEFDDDLYMEFDSILEDLYTADDYDFITDNKYFIADFGVDLSLYINNISYELESRIKNTAYKLLFNTINNKLISINPFIEKQANNIVGKWEAPNLLSAIYMEIFLAITQNKKVRKCKNSTCNKCFSIIGNDLRKKYCDTSCSMLEAKRMERARKNQKRSD